MLLENAYIVIEDGISQCQFVKQVKEMFYSYTVIKIFACNSGALITIFDGISVVRYIVDFDKIDDFINGNMKITDLDFEMF